ncbi:hypothetical protein ACB092_05G048700 [Castanea dentata]
MARTFSKSMASRSAIVEFLDEDDTENDLRKEFSVVGLLDYVDILPSNRGLVVFKLDTDACRAMNDLDGILLNGKKIKIIWVKNLVHFITNAGEVINPEEVPVFVLEARQKLVASINMQGLNDIQGFCQCLFSNLKHTSPLENISLQNPWPGYEVVYKHVDSIINASEEIVPNEGFEQWFLSVVNKIEFSVL